MTMHIDKHYPILFLSAICLTAFSYSCGTQKKVASHRQQEQLEQALRQINSATQSLDARYTVATGSMRLKGQVKVKEDSCLWLSAQFFGMEAGRVLLTDSSIQVIYRLQKLCFRQEGLPFLPIIRRYANAVLLHKIVLPDEKEPTIPDFITVKTDGGGWQLIRHESFGDLSYTLDKDLQLIESRCTVKGNDVTVSYSEFEEGFPTHIALASPDDNVSMEFTLAKITRNDTPHIDFAIPDGYSEVSVGQLLKMLKVGSINSPF